jgi:molybdopterin synthase sulfur carrier subunit
VKLRILYFAWLRERIGTAEEEVEVPDSVGTVADLTAWLAARGAAFASAFSATRAIRCAVNQSFAASGSRVSAGDEVAFFPPVTGG